MRHRRPEPSGFVARLGGALDDAISVLAPRMALKRRMARLAYRGASTDRIRENQPGTTGSADAELADGIDKLRARSRDLVQNDAFAAGILTTMVDNVVGGGLQPIPAPRADRLGVAPSVVETFIEAADAVWDRWVPHADVRGVLDFAGLQALFCRSALEAGDCGGNIVMLTDPRRPYSLAFEAVESDRIESPYGKQSDPSVRMGVEVGRRGKPTAYYVLPDHPGDRALGRRSEPRRIPRIAEKSGRLKFTLVYWPQRPGQTRGVPLFAPVLTAFDGLDDYFESEMTGARAAAGFAGFIKKTHPWDSLSGLRTNADGQRIEEIEPGTMSYLQPGEEVSFAEPGRPNPQFGPFVESVLRAIGAAVGLPFELVLRDFSKTNYSSARAALLEARRGFEVRRAQLITQLCVPAWKLLMEEAWLRGDLPDVDLLANFDEWTRVAWVPPPWGWVDPTKEIEASGRAIELGLSTRAQESRVQGRNWREVQEQLAREEAFIESLRPEPDPAPEPEPDEPDESEPEEAPEEEQDEQEAEETEEVEA